MSYIVKNKAKQPLVCSLADDTTLRLIIEGEKIVTEAQMTNHLRELSKRGIVIIREVVGKNKKTKNTTVLNSEEKEGGKINGNL